MNDSYKEQRPLLCEELSEEDVLSPHLPRRFRSNRSRARNTVKGAAAIITRWPDNCSSAFTVWMGVGMLTLTIFIIYNSMLAYALLPVPSASRPRTSIIHPSITVSSSLPEVHMHLFVNPTEAIDLNKYVPYIETISNKYLEFNYNLIIIYNDTSNQGNALNAEDRNEIAFSSLWINEHISGKDRNKTKSINIKKVTLSNYMNESPLRKDWRYLPNHFIEFLVRAVSIWDKGGIAFNPKILTPQYPQDIYTEKIKNIFKKYGKAKKEKLMAHDTSKQFNKQTVNIKQRVNNIRDIIEKLEHDDGALDSVPYSLTEAEDRDTQVFTDLFSGRRLLSTLQQEKSNVTEKRSNNTASYPKTHLKENQTDRLDGEHNGKNEMSIHKSLDVFKVFEDKDMISDMQNKTELSLLPLFLQFLFYNKPEVNVPKITSEETTTNKLSRKRKSVIPIDNVKNNTNNTPLFNYLHDIKNKSDNKLKPMIISTKSIKHDELYNSNDSNEISNKCEDGDPLTIDLKGNILATETACHAFLGTVFSNVIHHTGEETLKDFITAELSIFCKGLLSSCNGIDLILI